MMVGKLRYDFFHTSELKPSGWLKKQLEIQAEGLGGNLDKIWPDIRDSAWIGGNREGWERVPYWLDGFIPLAYLLENRDFIERAQKYIDALIGSQDEDGWICPCEKEQRRNYDTWAILLIAKVLALYGECSGDERIVPVLLKVYRQFDQHLNVHTLREWGAARWFEGLIGIYWLYGKTREDWLIGLAKKLEIEGFDWNKVFQSNYIDTFQTGWDLFSHVVNLAMALRSEALMSLFTGGDPEAFAKTALEYLDAHHGMPTGHFTGDETISGNSPLQGTELCGVVEAMYSYEILFAVSGNPKWLDRLEKLAYNALPAAISPDMWSHQYVQMTNQVACYPMEKQPFRNNNNQAHIFGLEPNYGCCTANFNQGWPKFALTAFMKGENEIASCALAPAKVTTKINGANISCELKTGYPFRNTLTYRVAADRPVEFTLSLRIPGWAKYATINGEKVPAGEFSTIDKVWDGEETLTVKLYGETKIIPRPEHMVCVWRGPLLYAVAVDERWESATYTQDGVERKYPYCDYFIYPESKWNYALTDDTFEIRENEFDAAFDPKKPPLEIYAKMAEIPWGFENGHCDRLPKSLVPVGEAYRVRMIPYGCTNLRMTEIPYLKK